jgi:lysophospholipase L1-like esterase
MSLKGKLLTIIIAIEVVVIIALVLKIFSNFQLQKTAMIVYTKEMENGKYKYFGVCDVTRRISDDKDLYVELIPDMHVMCPRGNKTIYIDINSKGFRDKEFSINKSSNTIRILAMGDSFTYGWYVNLNDTWPKKLEYLLNEKTNNGTNFEVLNLGIPGYDIWNVANLFAKKAYKYNPDAIIITFIENDVVPESYIYLKQCEDVSINTSKCKMVYKPEIVKILTSNDTHIIEYVNKSFAIIRDRFKKEIYLLLFPLSRYRYEEIIENLAKKYNINVCKLHEIYNKYPRDKLILSESDQHPSEFLYSLIAEKSYRCLNSIN